MNTSSVSQSQYNYNYYQTKTKKEEEASAQTTDELEALGLSVPRKPSGSPPKPPEEMDFENMSDSDLKDFLGKMQEMTGTIPGAEDGTAVEDLSEEQLGSIRELLTEMSENMKAGGKRMPPPGGPPQDVSSMSDEDLTSLLEMIKADTGTIPGVEDSENLSVSELTEEQLATARETLSTQQQERFQGSLRTRIDEMMKNGDGAQVMGNVLASASA